MKKFDVLKRKISFYIETHSREELLAPIIQMIVNIAVWSLIIAVFCFVFKITDLKSVILGLLLVAVVLGILYAIDYFIEAIFNKQDERKD